MHFHTAGEELQNLASRASRDEKGGGEAARDPMDLWRTCASGWVRRAGRQALRSFAMDLLRGRDPRQRPRAVWTVVVAAAGTAVVATAKGGGADGGGGRGKWRRRGPELLLPRASAPSRRGHLGSRRASEGFGGVLRATARAGEEAEDRFGYFGLIEGFFVKTKRFLSFT